MRGTFPLFGEQRKHAFIGDLLLILALKQNKKNAMQPTPIALWSCLALATAIPTFLTLNPKWYASFIAGRGAERMDPEDAQECFGALFAKVGLTRPDKLDVIITDGVGPTSLGVDGRDSVILFPLELFALMNPDTEVHFDSIGFHGRVGDLTEKQRNTLLDEGFLVPTEKQLQFIFGHELAHLKHRHTFETSKVAVLVALLTHFSLKLNNAIAHRSAKYRFMEVKEEEEEETKSTM